MDLDSNTPAPFYRCIAHELDQMVEHGVQVISLCKPMWDQASNTISWEFSTPGVWSNDGDNLITKSAVFVTTYDQMHDDHKLFS